MRRRATLLTLLLVGACAGSRPAAPGAAAVVAPQGWRAPAGEPGIVDPKWWAGFGDPALVRLVEAALANNTDLAIAATRVVAARAQLRGARGATLPSAALAAGGGPQRALNAFGLGTDQ